MKKTAWILWMLCAILTTCEKQDGEVDYSGDIILTSEKILSGEFYIIYGYSFERSDFIPFPATGGNLPDLVVINETDNQNNITGAVLSSPDNLEAFHLNGSFNTAEAAEAYYTSYVEVTDSVFTALAEDVTPDQVWTVRTGSGKYAKLIIKDVAVKTSQISEYIEISAGYHYQPDGSRSFGD